MGGPIGDSQSDVDGRRGRRILTKTCIAGILFAATTIGPGMAYGLGSLMLRLYVDIDRMPEGEPWGIHVPSRVHTRAVTDCRSYRRRKTRNPFRSPNSNTDHGQAFSFHSLGLFPHS